MEVSDPKPILICVVSKSLANRIDARDIVKALCEVGGGRGGGRADFAQAGGFDAGKLGEMEARFYALLEGL